MLSSAIAGYHKPPTRIDAARYPITCALLREGDHVHHHKSALHAHAPHHHVRLGIRRASQVLTEADAAETRAALRAHTFDATMQRRLTYYLGVNATDMGRGAVAPDEMERLAHYLLLTPLERFLLALARVTSAAQVRLPLFLSFSFSLFLSLSLLLLLRDVRSRWRER